MRAQNPSISNAALCAASVALAAGGLHAATPEAIKPAPDSLRGHFYIKPATGETVFTPAAEYLANRAGIRAVGDDITGDGVSDVWVVTNSDPCGVGTTGSPDISIAVIDNETTQGDYHLYRAHSQSGDLRVESLTWSYWSDIVDTDTNSDTIPDFNTRGAGFELTFWDQEDPFGASSSFGPLGRTQVATFSFTNMPGPLSAPIPGYLAGYVLTFDLTGLEFEMADTDGFGPATGAFNAFVGADTNSDTIADDDHNANSTHDWSYSIRGIQPTNPAPEEGLIGYQLAAPGVPGPVNTGNPFDFVIDTSGPFVLADSVIEPMGRAGLEFGETIPGQGERLLGRFSLFFASLNQAPASAGPSAGFPDSDFFAFGTLECDDLNSDTLPDGNVYTHPYIALSGDRTGEPFCDCDDSGTLNIDDIDCFVAAFLGGNVLGADCTGDGQLNIDDIDCFVACFLAG